MSPTNFWQNLLPVPAPRFSTFSNSKSAKAFTSYCLRRAVPRLMSMAVAARFRNSQVTIVARDEPRAGCEICRGKLQQQSPRPSITHSDTLHLTECSLNEPPTAITMRASMMSSDAKHEPRMP
jgi:hypothetical protein